MAPPGSEIWFRSPGSGGYGDPSRRDRARLREDVVHGYVTPRGAGRDYGVRSRKTLACPDCAAAASEADGS